MTRMHVTMAVVPKMRTAGSCTADAILDAWGEPVVGKHWYGYVRVCVCVRAFVVSLEQSGLWTGMRSEILLLVACKQPRTVVKEKLVKVKAFGQDTRSLGLKARDGWVDKFPAHTRAWVDV